MKKIKQRLLSLAMAGAMLLGSTLSEAFASSAKSGGESGVSKSSPTKATAAPVQKKSSGEQNQETDAQKDSKASKSSKSTNSEGKGSPKTEKAEKKADSSRKVSLTLSISKPSGLSAPGGVYQVDPDAVSALTLSWKCKGDCDSFEVSVSGGAYSASTGKKAVSIPVSGLSEGKYIATVKAIRDGKTVAREKLSFLITSSSALEAAQENVPESDGYDDSAEEFPLQQTPPVEGSAAEAEEVPEASQGIEEALPVRETEEYPTEEKPVEETQDASEGQSVQEAQDDSEEQPVEDTQDASNEQPAEEVQDASNEQPVEDTQDASEDISDIESSDIPDDVNSVISGEVLPELPEQQAQEDPIIEARDFPEALILDEGLEVLGKQEVTPSETDESPEPDEQPALKNLQDEQDNTVASNAQKKEKKADNTITLSVRGMQGLTVEDGSVHVDPAQAKAVTFVWDFGGDCDEYALSVSGGVYEGATKKKRLKLSVRDLPAGQYTLTVEAKKDGKKLSNARMRFSIDDAGGEAEISPLKITVASPQGLLITEGVYQVDPAQADALTVAWAFDGECDFYDVSVSGDAYTGRTEDNAFTLPLSGLAAGKYTVAVKAVSGDETVAQAQLTFEIPTEEKDPDQEDGEGDKQGDRSKGSPGKGGAGRSRASKGDGDGEADQGFRVTPGEVLVSTHTSGSRDMRPYGAVALTLDGEGPMSLLTLGGTVLDIRLSDGGLFTASIQEDALALVPEGDAEQWLLNGHALKTMARSGVATLRLTLGGMTVDFPTQPKLTGKNYGTLCAAGWASRDYSYAVYANGCSVTVAGQTFQLTPEGELA